MIRQVSCCFKDNQSRRNNERHATRYKPEILHESVIIFLQQSYRKVVNHRFSFSKNKVYNISNNY